MSKKILYVQAFFILVLASCIYPTEKNTNTTFSSDTEKETLIDSLSMVNKFFSKDKSYVITIYQIKDSVQFNDLYKKFHREKADPVYVKSIDSIRQMVKARVEMEENEYSFIMVDKFEALNGKIKIFDHSSEEGLLIAYYPEYNFMLMEGGHTSDDGYDLSTGENIYEAGNPSNQTLSPDHKYRISGIYGGQECSSYIIQEYKNHRFHKIADLQHENLCYFRKYFWVDSSTLYYSEQNYSTDAVKGITEYFKLTIQKHK